MKRSLKELEAEFIKLTSPDGSTLLRIDNLKDADGITFLCPKCFETNKGNIGTHWVICWWVGIDLKISPKPGRWTPSGTGLDDLTFIPSPGRSCSVLLTAGCKWHGFVKDGEAS